MPQVPASNLAMAIEAMLAITPFVAVAVLNFVFARRGWAPLTQLVEHYLRRYPIFAAVLSGFVGALVGHVFWSLGDNPPAPPAPFHLLPVALGLAFAIPVIGAVALAVIASTLHAVLPARSANRSA